MIAARIAVVGSGIAGLAAAHRLTAAGQQVTLFEADTRCGGHSHTVDVTLDGVTHGVDTGFLVFNHRTYPNLVRLFETLGVPTAASDMSFSVQAPTLGLEWSGADLDAAFAQRRNLLRPRFWRMLAEIRRFHGVATALATSAGPASAAAQREPVGAFLDRHGFGPWFREAYFLPMVGCIWSCSTAQMLRFPIGTLLRFCHNHGLLQFADRPQWFTVRGGSRQYVDRLLAGIGDVRTGTPVRRVRRQPPGHGGAGVVVATDQGSQRFDELVLACHADQALALLGDDASPGERAVLGAIRFQPNDAVLHTDATLLPRRRRAWAAWNYERAGDEGREHAAVCLHYWINRLQPLPWSQPVLVSLNPVREPAPATVLGRYRYQHPVFDAAAVEAQQRLPQLQGRAHTWFCGAWTRHGFHEDGLNSALEVARALHDRLAVGSSAGTAA
ncbi:MAG: FAD-dependent oxidoreductase [Rubrivivax sp.]